MIHFFQIGLSQPSVRHAQSALVACSELVPFNSDVNSSRSEFQLAISLLIWTSHGHDKIEAAHRTLALELSTNSMSVHRAAVPIIWHHRHSLILHLPLKCTKS